MSAADNNPPKISVVDSPPRKPSLISNMSKMSIAGSIRRAFSSSTISEAPPRLVDSRSGYHTSHVILEVNLLISESGQIRSGRVGSGRVGSGRVGSCRIGSDRIGSDRVTSCHVEYHIRSARFKSGVVTSCRVRVK